jgi:hypothetical protein
MKDLRNQTVVALFAPAKITLIIIDIRFVNDGERFSNCKQPHSSHSITVTPRIPYNFQMYL